jgi:hypothetical protein
MGKRTAKATPAENKFAEAYLEVLKLREDVERIEKLSKLRLRRPTGRHRPKADHRTRNSLLS